MGRRPNGSVSVINVEPADLPGICGNCRFFDQEIEYDREGNAREPEIDWETGYWLYGDGLCRRHPPTTGGKLPAVNGGDLGCGDGLA